MHILDIILFSRYREKRHFITVNLLLPHDSLNYIANQSLFNHFFRFFLVENDFKKIANTLYLINASKYIF